MKLLNLLVLATITLLLFAATALAQVDIVGPADQHLTNEASILFDYYVGMPNPISCSLNIDGTAIPDTSVETGLNAYAVENLVEGIYNWNIACVNSTTTETSESKTLILDFTQAEIQLTRPDAPDKELLIRLLVSDDYGPISCAIVSDGNTISEPLIDTDTWYEETQGGTVGDHTLRVSCTDLAGNTAIINRDYTIEQADFLALSMDQATYGLGEPALLTIDAPSDADVTIDICPVGEGFVQCISPIIGEQFPQTLTLPFTNQSGEYLIEGIAVTPRGTVVNSTRYTTENTMGVTLSTNKQPKLGETYELRAEVYGAMGEYTYVWELSNGSTIETTHGTIDLKQKLPGQKTEKVTVTDIAGNTKSDTLTYTIDETTLVDVLVKDKQTGDLLSGATVQIVGRETKYTTLSTGKVNVRLDIGTNKLYAAKDGYNYAYQTVEVLTTTTSITLELDSDNHPVKVSLDRPNDNMQFPEGAAFEIGFTVEGVMNTECALLLGPDSASFLEVYDDGPIPEDGPYIFTINPLPLGTYNYLVECTQGNSVATTETRSVLIGDPQADNAFNYEGGSDDLDAERELFDNALDALKSLSAKEQEFAEILGMTQKIRDAKRSAGLKGRDIFDLRYRKDLTAGEITAEEQKLRQELNRLVEETPISLKLEDSRTFVNYINEEELASFIEDNEEALIEEYGAYITKSSFQKKLLAAQQRYTLKTKIATAIIKYGDGTTEEISIVTKQFAYGQNAETTGDKEEYILEIIPKSVARDAKDLNIFGEHVVIIEDPVISFPAQERITYTVGGLVDMDDLEKVRSLLIPEIVIEQGITGYGIFGLDTLGGMADNWGLSLMTLVMFIISIFLVWQFGLIDQAKYLLWSAGPKTKLHYMRVLLNDIHDNISANNYDKALLIYKEAKLTYDKLATPAKNDLYDEFISVCAELDTSYLKRLVVEMDKALKEEQLAQAIEYYAKIEGTYERLPDDEKEQVIALVHGMAKRLGMEEGT